MAIRRFTLVMGLLFVFVGIFAFVPGVTAPPTSMDPSLAVESFHGRLFGLFPVNLLHNLVHLGLGVWGLVAAKDVAKSLLYCRSAAIIYLVLAVMGFVPGLNTLFGLLPLHGHDIWLHIILALPLAYFGFVKSDVYAGYRRDQTATI